MLHLVDNEGIRLYTAMELVNATISLRATNTNGGSK